MSEYVIYTDSACDVKPEVLKEWGVKFMPLTFVFDGEEKVYEDHEMDIKEFYDKLRNGGMAKTSAVNVDGFKTAFEQVLKEGKDVLYVGFSSGLSTTYNSARLAAEELSEEYPDRKIITIDTLAASAGQGLAVYFAVQKKNEGATMEEVAEYIESIKLNICHWVVVDDLDCLKRGGRVSATVAFVGGVLGIKPIIHVDNEGKLINVAKARGKKAAIATILDKYNELAKDPNSGTLFISNADNLEGAEELKAALKEKYGIEVELITDIGAVIGAHAGPGTIAFFFVGKER